MKLRIGIVLTIILSMIAIQTANGQSGNFSRKLYIFVESRACYGGIGNPTDAIGSLHVVGPEYDETITYPDGGPEDGYSLFELQNLGAYTVTATLTEGYRWHQSSEFIPSGEITGTKVVSITNDDLQYGLTAVVRRADLICPQIKFVGEPPLQLNIGDVVTYSVSYTNTSPLDGSYLLTYSHSIVLTPLKPVWNTYKITRTGVLKSGENRLDMFQFRASAPGYYSGAAELRLETADQINVVGAGTSIGRIMPIEPTPQITINLSLTATTVVVGQPFEATLSITSDTQTPVVVDAQQFRTLHRVISVITSDGQTLPLPAIWVAEIGTVARSWKIMILPVGSEISTWISACVYTDWSSVRVCAQANQSIIAHYSYFLPLVQN